MTAALPPLVLALAAGPRVVLAEAPPEQGARLLPGWEAEPPPGALFVHWPARFPWTPAADRFANRVVAAGGAVAPLTLVLSRIGVKPRPGPAGLLAALVPDLGEDADSGHAARRLVEALRDRLAAGAPSPPPGATPSPGVREDMGSLPDAPGVYRFLAGDGRVLYVGKAASLRRRVPAHFGAPPPEGEKSLRLAARAAHLVWTPAGSDLEAVLLEHTAIRGEAPALNVQAEVHERPTGAIPSLLCTLPSAAPGMVEVCVVAGSVGFHWERVPGRSRVPRGLWARVRAAAEGQPGWAPGAPGTILDPGSAASLRRLAGTWLAAHRDGVHHLDLDHETRGDALRGRLRLLLGTPPGDERVLPV